MGSKVVSILEPLQKSADFRIGPVGIAHDLAANDAGAIDDVGFGPYLGAVHFRDSLLRIANSRQVNVKAVEEAVVGARIGVDADGQDGQLGVFMVQRNQGRGFLDARPAVAPPEVQQHHLAAVFGKLYRVLAVVDLEVGRRLADLGRPGASIAAGDNQYNGRQQAKERYETRGTHIPIILKPKTQKNKERDVPGESRGR